MKIELLEGLTRYHVQSEHHAGDVYLVDLLPYVGIGCCSCPHYRIRLEPRIRAGKIGDPADYRCKHIRACRDKLSNDLLETLIKGERAKEKKQNNRIIK